MDVKVTSITCNFQLGANIMFPFCHPSCNVSFSVLLRPKQNKIVKVTHLKLSLERRNCNTRKICSISNIPWHVPSVLIKHFTFLETHTSMVLTFCPLSELACVSEFNNYAKAAQLLTGWELGCGAYHANTTKNNLSFRILKLAQLR
jgi:hypothetical protein